MVSLGRLPYAGLDANITINEIKSGFRLPVPEEIIHEYYVIDDEGWDEHTM